MKLLLHSKVAKAELYLIGGNHNEWLELTYYIETLDALYLKCILKTIQWQPLNFAFSLKHNHFAPEAKECGPFFLLRLYFGDGTSRDVKGGDKKKQIYGETDFYRKI